MRLRAIGATQQKARATVLALCLVLLLVPAIQLVANSGSHEKADRIEIRKSERTMTLLRDGKVLKT